MKRQKYLVAAFLSVPIILVFVAFLRREPRYEGKTSYQWVQEIKMPSNPAQPNQVLLALKEIKPSPVPILQDGLKSRQTSHRFKSAWSLGQLGEAAKPAIPDLIQALDDEDMGVRINAIGALVQIKAREPEIVPKVLPMLADSNLQLSGVAGELLNAIEKEKPGSVPLKAFLEATSPKTRLVGLSVLMDEETNAELKTISIRNLLNDTNGWVREQTVRYLVANGMEQTNLIFSTRSANLASLMIPTRK